MGLVQEGEETIEDGKEEEEGIADLALIMAAQKVEHYEIAASDGGRFFSPPNGGTGGRNPPPPPLGGGGEESDLFPHPKAQPSGGRQPKLS